MTAYYSSILYGALLTVGVSLAALAVSVVLGLLGAGAKLSGNRALVALATVYTTIIRGIPELVLMLLVFYGGSIGINTLLELSGTGATLEINPFTAGVLTLGFIYGALTRPAAVALGVIWLAGAIVFGPLRLIEHTEILGIAFFLFATGRGPLAFDMALEKLHKPLPRLIPYAVPVLRITLGIGLTVVASKPRLIRL